jgi:hypothetical protein
MYLQRVGNRLPDSKHHIPEDAHRHEDLKFNTVSTIIM